MGFFKNTAVERFGVVIDIGSGSALVSLVASKQGESEPTILWSKREVASLRNIESLHESSKSVMTALVNVLLEFETGGRQALHAYNKKATITEVQCSIAAPWSYTVTKNINYKQEENFTITEELLKELVATAKQKTDLELKEKEVVKELGLTIASRATLHTLVNGYNVSSVIDKEAKSLSLVHTSVVVHSYLIETLKDVHMKMFPKARLNIFSYALILHCVANETAPQNSNVCLVDVTYEATEMSIVRDGVIVYVTHTPFGTYSLAREIAAITKLPLVEALKHLQSEEPLAMLKSLPAGQQASITKLLEAYTESITALFLETGDDLAIPRHIVLHAEEREVPFLKEILGKAVKRVLKSDLVITDVTTILLDNTRNAGKEAPNDTAMVVAARFFHKGDHCLVIEQT